MAITWGSPVSKLQVGIDVSMSPGTVTASTTQVTVTVAYYVRSTEAYQDNQWLTLINGWNGERYDYYMSSSNGVTTDKHIVTKQVTVSTSYGGGPHFTFAAQVGGAYNGANPSHSRAFSVPARPATAPAAPTPVVSSITATTAYLSASGNGNGGSAYTNIEYQTATNSGFTANLRTHSPGSWNGMTVSGFTRGTTHWLRARARNAVGWSGWSGAITFTTLALPPGPPAAPTITAITPTSAVINWANPSDNGGAALTTFHIQLWDDPATAPANSNFWTKSTTPISATDLQPAKTYVARVRAVNGRGNGTWSPWTSFTTQSGAKIHTGSGWVDVPARVHNGSAFAVVVVRKNVAGTWAT